MNYIVEANIGIVFLYGTYLLLVRNETDFTRQRMFLVAGLLCSILFPLIQVQSSLDVQSEIRAYVLSDLEFYGGASQATSTISWSLTEVAFMIYLAIAFILGTPLLFQALKLYRTVRTGLGQHRGNYYIVESDANHPSWSFFRLIYIGSSGELTPEDKELVVKHEMLHGRLYHSADMLFATLVCVVFWFNPVVWFYRRTLAKVHEFQVDALVARQDGVVPYVELLAKAVLTQNGFILTHHFNQSFILKRINMITTIKNEISSWKLAALAMSIFIYFVSVSCADVDQQEQINQPEPWKGEVFNVVQTAPEPAGGYPDFMKEFSSLLKYPKAAKEKGIEGTVFVQFIVQPDGKLSDFTLLKGIDPDCDHAALVAVSKMKSWTPGFHDGKNVASKMVLPVKFDLN